MKYASCIYRVLNHFTDNSCWHLNRSAQDFQDYRNSLTAQWDDTAAADINARFLGPHAEDEARMRGFLERKNVAIQQLCEKLNEVERVNDQIRSLSEKIQQALVACEEDLRRSVTNYDFSHNRKNDAEARIPQTIVLLNTANQNEFSPTY
ncbi:hypothetical protein F0L74_23705 [Chitinophaga agrisoli]|uniref:Uncharacterized protein n=1 Tax=Chitinophaga agrisoli TaxID=2607653 RepID=A0A5B2VJU5_9BACT|nr:hypothetical protein [Chitinophaga agrisoli]KAA2239215.1 hypothetical protein F0L74_23705 [Chitinophaga agrisoli]